MFIEQPENETGYSLMNMISSVDTKQDAWDILLYNQLDCGRREMRDFSADYHADTSRESG